MASATDPQPGADVAHFAAQLGLASALVDPLVEVLLRNRRVGEDETTAAIEYLVDTGLGAALVGPAPLLRRLGEPFIDPAISRQFVELVADSDDEPDDLLQLVLYTLCERDFRLAGPAPDAQLDQLRDVASWPHFGGTRAAWVARVAPPTTNGFRRRVVAEVDGPAVVAARLRDTEWFNDHEAVLAQLDAELVPSLDLDDRLEAQRTLITTRQIIDSSSPHQRTIELALELDRVSDDHTRRTLAALPSCGHHTLVALRSVDPTMWVASNRRPREGSAPWHTWSTTTCGRHGAPVEASAAGTALVLSRIARPTLTAIAADLRKAGNA